MQKSKNKDGIDKPSAKKWLGLEILCGIIFPEGMWYPGIPAVILKSYGISQFRKRYYRRSGVVNSYAT